MLIGDVLLRVYGAYRRQEWRRFNREVTPKYIASRVGAPPPAALDILIENGQNTGDIKHLLERKQNQAKCGQYAHVM